MIDVFESLYAKNTNVFFVVVSAYNHEEICAWFKARKIPKTAYFLTQNISNEEVKGFISAADIGVSAVPPSPVHEVPITYKSGRIPALRLALYYM